jgi:hypothetical protein
VWSIKRRNDRKLLEVRISRKRWLRSCGQYSDSALRLENGKQCCLGFLARACGYTVKDILNLADPQDLLGELKDKDENAKLQGPIANLLHEGRNTPLCVGLIKYNDNVDGSLSPKEQEKLIRDGFKEIGAKAVFVP